MRSNLPLASSRNSATIGALASATTGAGIGAGAAVLSAGTAPLSAGAVTLRAGTSSPPTAVTGWVAGASVKPCTAAAKPVTATQVTTLIKAMILAARRLARSPTAAVLFMSISDTPLNREIRMVSACPSIARWLTQAGRLVAILYDSISPHRVGRDQQRHWREEGTAPIAGDIGL